MENKLEQLLNSLIEKGWKPFGHEYVSAEHLEFKYYDERLDKALKSEPMINLENYFKIFKNVP
jgi:hypothetical protein